MAWVEVVTGAIAKASAAGPKVALKDVTVGTGVALPSPTAQMMGMPFDEHGDLPTADDVDDDAFGAPQRSNSLSGGVGAANGAGGGGGADLSSAAVADMAELYKDGFLEKKGSQRWFLFNGETLSWAMKPTTSDFIGTIQLGVTEVVGGPKPTQFTLKTPTKNYVLTAKSNTEAKAW